MNNQSVIEMTNFQITKKKKKKKVEVDKNLYNLKNSKHTANGPQWEISVQEVEKFSD